LRLKQLFSGKFEIVAILDGEVCPAERFLLDGEKSTEASRLGLMQMLSEVAEVGLQKVPQSWVHEADKTLKIYEFIKGPLRLFFFKGKNGQIAVCTTGVRKSGDKADNAAVKKAAKLRNDYYEALKNETLTTVIENET
jgi:hypothetical protein